MAEGLSGGAVHDVAQDRDGLMWFAVGSDLVRFDGVEFTAFRHRRDDSSSLPAGSKRGLFVDRDNRLWVGSVDSGLIRRAADGRGFFRWVHDAGDPGSLSSDEVWSIAQTSDGELWVGTGAGLDRLLADGRHFGHLVPPPAAGRSGFGAVHALLAESDGRLWIGTGHGLFLRSPAGMVERVPVDPRLPGEPEVWRIQGGGNDVRVAVSGGSLRVDPDGVARLVAPTVRPAVVVHGSVRDQLGRLWTATSNGLYFEDGGRVTRIPAQPQLRGGLPGNHVGQVLVDHEGGLWLALDDDGVGYLAPNWNRFTRLTHIPGDATSLSEYAASAVLASGDGGLWVGSAGTLDKLDPATGRVQHVVSGLPGEVRDLLEDRDGSLWIVVQDAVYRHARGSLLQVDTRPAGVLEPQRLALGADGAVLVASLHRGMFRIDPRTLVMAPAAWDLAGGDLVLPNRLTSNPVLDWYAAGEHLRHWNVARARFDDVSGFTSGGPVLALETATDGLWVARGDRFEHYRTDGSRLVRDREWPKLADWPALTLRAMHVDRLGRIWLFAGEGLWRFEPEPGRLVAFGPRHGLESGRMDGVSPVGGRGGMVYFAGPDGVTGFWPDRALAQFGHPRLSLASVKVGRRGQALSLPTSPGALQLDWNDGGLRIAARLASYVDPRSNQYRYRLHGLDEDWVDTGHRAEREFPVLAAGNYTLEVAAAGADGWWSELDQPLHITVRSPPWVAAWQAWALYLACATLLLALWALVQRRFRLAAQRLHMLETQRRMAEQASEAKTSFLTMLSHEIRTPMTGIMGMTELLLGSGLSPVQRDYVRAMQRSGGMLMRLLNDALDLARIEAGRLELEPAPFDPRELLREVQQLESGLAELKGIRLECHVADGVPDQVVGDALRIKQVLLNLVGNALKFTDHGRVLMTARAGPAGLLFSVSDTGPGISAANRPRLFQRFEQLPGPHRAAGSGLGLAICRELVGLMGGSIDDEPAAGGGTTFRVQLPLPAVPAAEPHGSPHPPEPRWEVLLVEHDAGLAHGMCAGLEAHGHAVRQVGNALQALAELAQARFDLVLLETELRGVDGFGVARLMRAVQLERSGPAIVAIAARVDEAGEARVRGAGMHGLVGKPFRDEQWLHVLSRVMASRTAHGHTARRPTDGLGPLSPGSAGGEG